VLLQPYQLEELSFAWCYRLYCRWQTHRRQPFAALTDLNAETLSSLLEPYSIHVLEASAEPTEAKMLASLLPNDTVSTCVAKTKGRVSKWLREQLELQEPRKLLSRGYFACTAGKSTAEAVEQYLDAQGDHHGYASRANPPVFVQSSPLTPADEQRLAAQHAVTDLRFHLVLATWRRKGVFGRAEGESITARWRAMQDELSMALEKVSFVPDHVHLAIHIHPRVSPAKLVVALMNAAQELCWGQHETSVVRAGVERLWQPSAYIGTYGDLESAKIAACIRRWEQQPDQ
jgi:REP element-mobilizing transposase RayT